MNASTKTLTSLAILKVNWDLLKKDYIENFIPFVTNLLKKDDYKNGINTNFLKKDFEDEYGLILPHFPLVTILNRAAKKGLLKREYGSFYIIKDKIAGEDISLKSQEQLRKLNQVVGEFIEFSHKNYTKELTKQDAENSFLTFIRDEDLATIFGTGDLESVMPEIKESSNSSELHYITAKFIQWAREESETIFRFIVDLSIGQILAHTILFNNLASFKGKLRGANFYLDVAFLFNILGINGPGNKEVYDDLIRDLREEGTNLYVFQHTHTEFMKNLENAMRSLEFINYTPEKGEKIARTLQIFLDDNYSPSDVEMIIAKAPSVIENAGIKIINKPLWKEKEYKYNIDENNLYENILAVYKERVQNFDENEYVGTIQRDVDSISAIERLRQGVRPASLVAARHTLITSNAGLARACYQFSNKSGGFSIPPCLHDRFVGTLLWLEKPAKVTNINEKKIIADTYAALRPSPHLVKQYLAKITELRESGRISDDDYLILRSDRMARNLLQEETLGVVTNLTEQVPLRILQDIKTEIKKEETSKLLMEKESHDEARGKLKEEHGRRISMEEKIKHTTHITSIIIGCAALLILIVINILVLGHWSKISIVVPIISAVIGILYLKFYKAVEKFIFNLIQKYFGIQ